MKLILNGIIKDYRGDPELSLLRYLREQEGILSPKDGCAPQAACGCCIVELNGKATLACITPMKKTENGRVVTIEGLTAYQRRVFANAFVAKSGVQCGFCIPGIIMQSKVLLDHNPHPSREQVKQALTPHLCRCTGYKKIEDAILLAAAAFREGCEIPAPTCDGRLGSRFPKYDATMTVLGQRPYVADLHVPGILFGALKLSAYPRARVLAIHTEAAERLPGVSRVFTAKDIPGERHLGLIISDWPLMITVGEETRYVGDVLAGVVAETEEIARHALNLIQIEYDVLVPVTDPHVALQPESPKLHVSGNLLSETVLDRGNVDKALAEAAFISQGVYLTQIVEHGFLEPECCLAMPHNEGLKVFSQGQGVYDDQKQIARLLDLPEYMVEVKSVPSGGAFGGKEDLSVQGHAALFAHHLQQPVKITLTREESILMHPKRHPLEMAYTLACNRAGKLTALQADIIGDTGAYASVGMKVLERAAGHATGAYHIPNVRIRSRAVYTNNIPCGAMRGFGVNQVTFALESCIDDLCEQGGFDRWQIRYDNALKDGDMTATGQIIHGGCGLQATLLAVKDHFKQARYAGIACGLKNTGIGNGMREEGKVKIVIVSPNTVVLHHGWTEMGQGVDTMAVQFLCHETGLDPGLIEIRVETTARATAGMTTASRATSILGNAIIKAAQALRRDLAAHTVAELVGKSYEGEWVCDWTTKPGAHTDEVITHYSYSYATQVAVLDDHGNVATVYAAHDAGKIINPNLFEGQIEGSIHMGLGYALTEELVLENGVPVSTRLRKCGILRAKDMPEIVVIGVEVADPHGPYGAKGVGEIGMVPTAAAVANALYQYDGLRRYRLPMKRGAARDLNTALEDSD